MYIEKNQINEMKSYSVLQEPWVHLEVENDISSKNIMPIKKVTVRLISAHLRDFVQILSTIFVNVIAFLLFLSYLYVLFCPFPFHLSISFWRDFNKRWKYNKWWEKRKKRKTTTLGTKVIGQLCKILLLWKLWKKCQIWWWMKSLALFWYLPTKI